MVLYILTPHTYNTSYNNYMNNYFKLNNWTEAINKYNPNISIEYIFPEYKISPNINEDYLLVTDIQSKQFIKYYNDYVVLFKKENRFVMIYECLMHNIHIWKYKYITDNFNLIFQNSTKLSQKHNILWIPCYNFYMKHNFYNNTKDKFCCVSPIFNIGDSLDDKKVLERVKIIKDFCNKDNRIHVYGTNKWKNEISPINFKGNIPNEGTSGITGNFNLEEKIKNKCELLSQYKFNLVFENLFIDGFVSEKLVESLFSNSIIIYYGPKNIKFLYPDLFDNGVINGHDYTVDEIVNIMNNMSNEEYKERIAIIQSLRDQLNWNNSSENIKNIVMDKIKQYINKS